MSDYYAMCVCGNEIRVNMFGMGHCTDCGRDRNPIAETVVPKPKPLFDEDDPMDGFDMVLDGARHEDELPNLLTTAQTASFVSEGGSSYPDWTDDRLYRLVDECQIFIDEYNAQGHKIGAPAAARRQMERIYDLVVEDGR